MDTIHGDSKNQRHVYIIDDNIYIILYGYVIPNYSFRIGCNKR